MSKRSEITSMLRELTVKRLKSKTTYFSPEVDFDKNTDHERRVDFVGFKPFTPGLIVESTSVDLGTFSFYEIKSGMADFKSGNGLTFYGDSNYLVTTREFADELISKWLVPRNIDMILTPNSTGTALYPRHKVVAAGIQSYRKRPASEILWNMVQSHNRDLGGY